jgi:hypothetical protein
MVALLESAVKAFLLTILGISFRTVWKVLTTFTDSKADVSIKDMAFFFARAVASLILTSRMYGNNQNTNRNVNLVDVIRDN